MSHFFNLRLAKGMVLLIYLKDLSQNNLLFSDNPLYAPKVDKGRHIKVPPAGCKGSSRGTSRGFRGIFSRGAIYFNNYICFSERPAAIFHDPLDPPGSVFRPAGESTPGFMANLPQNSSLACNLLHSEAIPLRNLWQIDL